MLFIENSFFIKPEYMRHTSYIRTFNIEVNKYSSFFLRSNDWDKFSAYMAEKRPDIPLELEYPVLDDTQ